MGQELRPSKTAQASICSVEVADQDCESVETMAVVTKHMQSRQQVEVVEAAVGVTCGREP
jgi:hypothetical protein